MNNLNIIVRMRFGSYLYGTDTPDSDTDFKGIFLPTKDEVLLGKVPKSYNFTTKPKGAEGRNTSEDIDNEIYSLHYFLKLALEGQTVAIDMLHAPDNMIVEQDDKGIWSYLINHRKMFYTKNLKAFVGYARRQAAKYGVKGSRLNDAKEVLEFLAEHTTNGDILTMGDIWDQLPKGEHIHFTEPDRQGNIFYQVCGKMMQKTIKVNYAFGIINKFYEEYGKRAQLAAENKGIDFKAISHAVRAALQIKEMLIKNTITFPLPMADYVRNIKKGKLDYKTIVAPHLESLMEEVEILTEKSTLPNKPDYKFWEEWLCFVLEDNLFAEDYSCGPMFGEDIGL